MPIFFGNNHHLNDIFTKGGQKRTKAATISKEEVKCCQKVTSFDKIYLKEHNFSQS